jgi:hypothetical protein
MINSICSHGLGMNPNMRIGIKGEEIKNLNIIQRVTFLTTYDFQNLYSAHQEFSLWDLRSSYR